MPCCTQSYFTIDNGKPTVFSCSNLLIRYVKPDCIIATGTWLSPTTHSSEVLPDDYITYRKDRNVSYGGTLVAIKSSYNSSLIRTDGDNCEIAWAEVQLKKSTSLIIGSYYRSSSSTIQSIQELDKSLCNLPPNKKNKNLLLGGDFNKPDINWAIPTVNEGVKNKTLQEELINVSVQHGITQIQDKPTRENTILDLCFTNNPSLITYTDVIPGISDHDMVVVDQDLRTINPSQGRFTNTNKQIGTP